VVIFWYLESEVKCLRKREEGVEYYTDSWNGHWLLITNGGFDSSSSSSSSPSLSSSSPPSPVNSRNYGVISVSHDREVRSVLVSPSSEVQINDVDIFANWIVLYERANSLPRIRVLSISNSLNGSPEITAETVVPLPEVGAIEAGINLDYYGKKLRFTFSSPIQHPRIFDFDMESKELKCIAEKKPQIHFEETAYESRRVMVKSFDGALVPMTLVHSKDMRLDSSNRVIVQVYGAYGHCVEAEWRAETAALLRLGWVICLAHVRGGGEKGRSWYDDGRLLHKYKGINDLAACTKYLSDEKISKPSLIGATAASAGGLLLAALANEHGRSLVGSMVLRVPFVDVLSAMSDPTLPLTQHEYDEFGNPSDLEIRKAIAKYDPYQNVQGSHRYPHMLLTASLRDIRVPYWGPLKFVAKLRDAKRRQNSTSKSDSKKKAANDLLLLRLDDDRGHFGEMGRSGHVREKAFEIAFLEMAIERSSKDD